MSKKLVAYFTASGQTGTAAKRIANLLKADIYEIKPKTPMHLKISIGTIKVPVQQSNAKIEQVVQN